MSWEKLDVFVSKQKAMLDSKVLERGDEKQFEEWMKSTDRGALTPLQLFEKIKENTELAIQAYSLGDLKEVEKRLIHTANYTYITHRKIERHGIQT